MPLYPEMLRAREHASTPSPSNVFIFGLTIEFIKELGGVSHVGGQVGVFVWRL
jgi:hypothetical protein